MKSLHQQIRDEFPNFNFGDPATDADISRVENLLSIRFPAWLRDVYLNFNGIKCEWSYWCLRPLEGEHGLVRWNQFLRNGWDEYHPQYKESCPEIDWDALNISRLLFIAADGIGCDEWGFHIQSDNQQIIAFDVRNPDDQRVVGSNLLEVYRASETRSREINEQLFRGRTAYNQLPIDSPDARDIDRLIKALNTAAYGYREDTPWQFQRAISQRPGEQGELFIFDCGGENEIQFISTDGNLPFILRLKSWTMDDRPLCIVRTIEDAIARVIGIRQILPHSWQTDETTGKPLKIKRAEIDLTWLPSPGESDRTLSCIVQILGTRDDNRRNEDNSMGKPFGID